MLRGAAGYSQAGLAGLIGVSRETISRLEHGHIRPKLETAVALSVALRCTIDDLFPHLEFERLDSRGSLKNLRERTGTSADPEQP